jgi:hypothetical protein
MLTVAINVGQETGHNRLGVELQAMLVSLALIGSQQRCTFPMLGASAHRYLLQTMAAPCLPSLLCRTQPTGRKRGPASVQTWTGRLLPGGHCGQMAQHNSISGGRRGLIRAG